MEIGVQWYCHEGITARGNYTLASRCNIEAYPMFVSATHVMSYPNYSITDELSTDFQVEIGAHP